MPPEPAPLDDAIIARATRGLACTMERRWQAESKIGAMRYNRTRIEKPLS
jgi:hypothetical protein